MSSNDSMSSSRLSQFGLYRTIDARTEEFLKLSRRRQIRQGCACAAISSAVTVTVVVIILIIYEYAIAVEWSLVQNTRALRKNDNKSVTNDNPVADRLDRSYFGFDQDYYERMPLLVNAMQENSYVDPYIDLPMHKQGTNTVTIKHTISATTHSPRASIRRTSPRPFIYEMRSPTPVPFSKTFGSKSWIESYRNAQRLKNIQEIIKYLEKTINAKVADLHSVPSTHIAFSGVYVEPDVHNKNVDISQSATEDLQAVSSINKDFFKSSSVPDPLFRFKPDTPSDVNMLAEIPMFRPIPTHNKNNPLQSSSNKHSTVLKPKTFSVMLSLFPLHNSHLDWKKRYTTKSLPPLEDYISITTTRKPQFRRKSTIPIRRVIQNKRPRLLPISTVNKHKPDFNFGEKAYQNVSNKPTNMILHINVYAPDKTTESSSYKSNLTQENYGSPDIKNYEPSTEIPFQTSTVKVEDFHIGSSGIIPIETRMNPEVTSSPKIVTTTPVFEITPSTNLFTTPTPPEMMKFSHEDAKMPYEYQKFIPNNEYNLNMDMERRSMKESLETSLEMDQKEDTNKADIYIKDNTKNVGDGNKNIVNTWEQNTILIKLKNILEKDTKDNLMETSIKDNLETTTISQINGHSRNLYQNTKKVNKWLDPNSEANRKRRYELYAKGFRRASFNNTYVEIKRNITIPSNDTDKYNDYNE
ncbi:uncharacterized protein LOC128670965 isoform X2 [Plodia interpunctella]|uniref:uncharacterized protein LOC128670965 isoform X2 n=1 Tax=Plodia interpunctella TaxID=58824 RepID=UPI00236765DF|nr:uncharacterized protein LOC128670965 isoform X2 [Plodia interpunctella]